MYQQGGECFTQTTPRGVTTQKESILLTVHTFEILHLFRGTCIWVAFARCVEPLLLLEGPAIFQVLWALLVVLSPFYLFLRTSYVLLGCVEPLPMSLGTKFCLLQMTLLWLFIGFWSFGWVPSSFPFFCFIISAVCVLVLIMHSSRGRLQTHGWYVPMWSQCDEWLSTWFVSWVEFMN